MAGYDWEAIKAQHPIADVVGQSVTLKKRGREFVGLCPFHADRNPSFQVIPDKGFAHCPSCGWHGDVIKFVSHYKKCTPVEAINFLTGGTEIKETEEIRAERRRMLEEREQEEAEKRRKAIDEASAIWESAGPASPDHPYLKRKNVAEHGLRQRDDKLILPVFDADGEIQSIQTIDKDGVKKFHFGAPMSGGRMYIGISWDEPVILCEGYATGATIYDALPQQVIPTFSMGNMEKVARMFAEAGRSVLLAADTGTSAKRMEALAEELGLALAVPAEVEMDGGEIGSDFNDQAMIEGIDAVRKILVSAIALHKKRCKAKKEITPESSIYADKDDLESLPFSLDGVNLKSPPGFAGELADWIESQSRRPRRTISVAAALTAIGNIAGLRFIDGRDGTTPNLFAFCIAGSRTGKESANQAVAAIHRAAGVAGATHGSIKSEQEIIRNLIRHQAALYVVDEIGDLLQKIKNAQKRGGAIYLDGVIAMLMSAYSKADGFMLLTGDAKEEIKGNLIKELAQLNKKVDDGDAVEGSDYITQKIALLERQLTNLDYGLERPFLSMIGFTTPVAFDNLVDYQSATNGFIGRSLIFNERDTAPRSKVKKGFRKPPMPEGMEMRIAGMAGGKEYSSQALKRVENYGERTAIECDDDADEMLEHALDWFEDQAVLHKGSSGLESLYLGAYELLSKISLILAIPEGIKRAEHVRWAFALVRRDVDEKVRLVTANDREKDSPMLALQARIVNLCSSEDGETLGVIYNRMRGKKREEVDKAIVELIERGGLVKVETVHKFTKKKTVRLVVGGV